MFIKDKNHLKGFLHRTQRSFCGYDPYGIVVQGTITPPPSFCDCKYGATLPNLGPTEKNGCPELRCMVELLSLMTEEEYATIMERGNHSTI